MTITGSDARVSRAIYNIVSLDSDSAPLLAGIDPGRDIAGLDSVCRRPAFMGMAAVAQDEGGAHLGYIIGDDMGDEAEIIHLAVAASHRRMGIGARLLGAFIAARRRCFLEVRADNMAAIALYESAGFRAVGRREGYYGGIDGLRMVLEAS